MALFISILFSAFAVFVAVGYYRKNQQYHGLLVQGGKLYEDQRRELDFAKKKIATFTSEQKSMEDDLHSARASLLAATSKCSQIEGQYIQMQASYERKITSIESQRDHILAKFEAIQASTDQNEAQRNQDKEQIANLLDQINALRQQKDQAKEQASLSLKSENSELRRKVNDLERDLAFHKARKEIDPREFETIKRKVAHSDQLYRSMKGLRDLTDERNRNWEQALTHLSTWILTKSSLARENDPILTQPVGPLVGEALERIGASLIATNAHEELMAERQAINLADM